MSEPPDLAALAKRYVELWQDYLTAAAADPDLADSLARLLVGLGTVASLSPWQAWQRAATWRERPPHGAAAPDLHDHAAPQRSPSARPTPADAASRAASASPPSDERDDGMAELA